MESSRNKICVFVREREKGKRERHTHTEIETETRRGIVVSGIFIHSKDLY